MRKIQMTMVLLMALMLIVAGCDREITGDVGQGDNSSENCFACHNGALDQAQGEWANSVHASGSNVDYTNRGGSDCTKCHNQQGFIQFLATGELPDEPFSTVSSIGCFSCHNPHSTGDFTLRTSAPYTLADGDIFDHEAGNLCVACHHSRKNADAIVDSTSTSRYWGPHHGPQGDMLNGSNGWEFPGLGYTIATSPHATVVRDACAGCHMGNVRAHDGFAIGGHSWNMTDDASGSHLGKLCGDCHTGASSFDFTADADYDGNGSIDGYQTEFDGILDSLRTLLVGQGVLDGTDHATSGVIADKHLAGSVYNFLYALEDRSRGAHNFDYIRTLIEASMAYVSALPAPSPAQPGAVALNSHR